MKVHHTEYIYEEKKLRGWVRELFFITMKTVRRAIYKIDFLIPVKKNKKKSTAILRRITASRV